MCETDNPVIISRIRFLSSFFFVYFWTLVLNMLWLYFWNRTRNVLLAKTVALCSHFCWNSRQKHSMWCNIMFWSMNWCLCYWCPAFVFVVGGQSRARVRCQRMPAFELASFRLRQVQGSSQTATPAKRKIHVSPKTDRLNIFCSEDSSL